LAIALAPDLKHSLVNDIREGALRIVGQGFPDDLRVISSAPERPLPSHQTDEYALPFHLLSHVAMPSLMRWEGGEVIRLEVYDGG
jgi:hypothetical protein